MVEDDERIRTSTRLALEDEGYDVAEADSAELALATIAIQDPDVVIVDLMLPGMDGFQCCREIRRTSDVPIIVVTARSDTHDVVAGLEAGADDYMTKPFVVKELAARIRAHLRRTGGAAGPTAGGSAGGTRSTAVVTPAWTFGDVEVLPDAGEVRRAGEPVHLTRTELRLLCELAANMGRVLSREQLLEQVWGYDYFGDSRLVDVHIRRLRTKIEPNPAAPQHVVTVRGLGYKLAS